MSGEGVFDTNDQHEIFLALASHPPRPLRSVAPAVPDGVAQVIDKALAVDKQARWPSAEAMREALRQAHSGPTVATRPSQLLAELLASDSPLARATPQRSARVVWLALLLLLMAAIAVAGVITRHHADEPDQRQKLHEAR